MYYDLDGLEKWSKDLGFNSKRPTRDKIEITISDGVILEFHNLLDTQDTVAGFTGMPWHFHGKLVTDVGDGKYRELDEFEILIELESGVLLIQEFYQDGKLNDRWLINKNCETNFKYIQAGEEFRIRMIR